MMEHESLQKSQTLTNVKHKKYRYLLPDPLRKKQKTCESSGNSYTPKNINAVLTPTRSSFSKLPTIISNLPSSQSFKHPASIHPIPEKVNSRLQICEPSEDSDSDNDCLEVVDSDNDCLEVIEKDNDWIEIIENDFHHYNYWNCTLPTEADVLAQVLNYLHSKDLFRVKLICSRWNAVASRSFLWKHLYLQGLLVTNWNLLADFIEAKNVVMLNMRGMKLSQDICEMWKEFNSILPRLSSVKKMTLCKVPASISYKLATKLPQLTHFASCEIFDSILDQDKECKLYMGKFNKLTKLRSLEINGLKGLFIAKTFFSDDFLSSDALKYLKHLSLTTFAGITFSQIESLSLFKELTILELGNCSDWIDDHYLRLVLLTKLKKLRLEYGGTNTSPILCEVLKRLAELETLELILFHIPPNFTHALACLKKLRILTVWPNEENGASNSYRLTTALKAANQLENFVWFLLAPELVREVCIQKKMDDESRFIPYFAEENAGSCGKSVKLSETKINTNELMDKLRVILPFATIRVVIVPNNSYLAVRRASTNITLVNRLN